MIINKFSSIALVALWVIMGSLSFSDWAVAEGRCPPGQYPIGDDRAPGCAPIPGAGGASGAPPQAKPTGRWIKTWGSFALSPNGESGVANGRRRKADAEKDAVAICAQAGGNGCSPAFTYKNQCAAAAVPTAGSGGTSFGRSATQEISKGIALKACQAGGGENCQVIYSACTEPEFQAF